MTTAFRIPGSSQPLNEVKKSCWLCSLDESDMLAVKLFELGTRGPKTADRLQAIQSLLDADKRPEAKQITPKQVVNHLGRHDRQPVPSIGYIRRNFHQLEAWMSERDKGIISFLGHAQVATAEQIEQLFWTATPGTEAAYRRRAVADRLFRLCQRHMLYRVPQYVDRHSVYCLGKGGAEYLGPEMKWPVVGDRAKAPKKIKHELDLIDTLIGLYRSEGECQLAGIPARVGLDLDNCWAAPHLAVRVKYEKHFDAEGVLHPAEDRITKPDGLAAFSIQLQPDAGEITDIPTSLLLPTLLEIDTGSRPYHEIGAQFADYFPLANSGAIKERFPQLQAEGYTVPMVVVADVYRKRHQYQTWKSRIRGIRAAFEKECRSRGYKLEQMPPLFLAYRPEVLERGLRAPIWDLRQPAQDDDKRHPLVIELLSCSQALIQSEAVSAETILRIDQTAAAWRGPKELGLARRAEREKRQGAAAAGQADQVEQLRRKLRESEQARAEILAARAGAPLTQEEAA